MASIEVTARLFENSLRALVNDIVWKDQIRANNSNTSSQTDIIVADRYTAAARRLLEKYSINELIAISDYNDNKFRAFCNKAPTTYLEYLADFRSYTEKNDYYRMLYGLPPYNCEDKYIIRVPLGNSWGVEPGTAIHTLPYNQRIIIENDGYLDSYKELSKKEKNLEYVNHMTSKRIHPFIARLAQRFELLYVPSTEIETLSNDFRLVYAECRDYILARYYSDAYRNQNDQYEGFIGMSILFMTLQRMHTKYLETDITRDFYDLDSIKIIYDAYSVPFYEDIPTQYHQKVVKAINRLISYKGSNQVFFDLCSLFDYSTLQIYQYYLLKKHKMDVNGNPVFVKKADGSYDNKSMYDVCFIQGTIGGDPYLEVTDPENELDYYGVTSVDKFWFNDSDLLNKIYDMEYNYIETKYIGLKMVFSVTRFMFESCYFIRLIMDNRDKMSNITVNNGKIGIDMDLFTLIIYIHALICLSLGYEGNLPEEPEQIAKVMGFNFKDDIQVLIDTIENDPNISDTVSADVLNEISKINITDLNSVHTSYEAIKSLYNYIQDVMWHTHEPDVYFAYKHIYHLILATKLKDETFTKSNGNVAKTYMDLLEDLDMSLALRIKYMTESELTVELQSALITLQKVSANVVYIQNFGTATGEVIAGYLYKLIRLFKSAKAELADFNIVYIVDSRVSNMLKLMVELEAVSRDTDLNGDEMRLLDEINRVIGKMLVKTELTLKDFVLMEQLSIYLSVKLPLRVKLYMVAATMDLSSKYENIQLDDFIEYFESTTKLIDSLGIKDHMMQLYDVASAVVSVKVKSHVVLGDNMKNIDSTTNAYSSMYFDDNINPSNVASISNPFGLKCKLIEVPST